MFPRLVTITTAYPGSMFKRTRRGLQLTMPTCSKVFRVESSHFETFFFNWQKNNFEFENITTTI